MRPFEVSGHDSEFKAALTDAGICYVRSGDTLKATYATSKRFVMERLRISDTFRFLPTAKP